VDPSTRERKAKDANQSDLLTENHKDFRSLTLWFASNRLIQVPEVGLEPTQGFTLTGF
jgi:hypothetical protein